MTCDRAIEAVRWQVEAAPASHGLTSSPHEGRGERSELGRAPMNINGKPYRTIWSARTAVAVEIIDQTKLPHALIPSR